MRELTLTPKWFSGYNGGWYQKQATNWDYHEYCGYASNSGNLTYVVALDIPVGHKGKITNVIFEEGPLFSCPYSASVSSSLRWTLSDALDQTDWGKSIQGNSLATGTVTVPKYTTTWEKHEATSWNEPTISDSFTIDTFTCTTRVYLYIHRNGENRALRRCGYRAPVIKLQYEPEKYSIDIKKGTGVKDVTGNLEVAYGDNVSLTAVMETGYLFNNWSGYTNSTSIQLYFTMPRNNIVLTATGIPEEYSVEYSDGGYSVSNMPDNQTKIFGKKLTLSDVVPIIETTDLDPILITLKSSPEKTLHVRRRELYSFTEWNTGTKGYQPGDEYTDNSDVVLTLQCSSTIDVDSIKLPTPTRNGYEFLGWSVFEGSDVPDIPELYQPDSNITLHPVWKSKGIVYIDKNNGWVPHTIWIDDGTTWKQYVAYYDTGTEWKLCGSTE